MKRSQPSDLAGTAPAAAPVVIEWACAPIDLQHAAIASRQKNSVRSPHHRAHAHVPLPAILLIVGSVLLFTVLDATIKTLTQRYPVPLLVWARYGVQTVAMMLWLLPQMGTALLRTHRLRLHLARAAILPFSSLCFFSSLKYLPLAEATAINYSTPVLVVIMALSLIHI